MIDPSLPPIESEEALDRLKADDAASLAVVNAFAADLDVAGEVALVHKGSLPIGIAGDVVIKVFPPLSRSHARTEARMLEFLANELPVATPRLHGRCEREGWTALAMSRIRGCSFTEVADDLTAEERLGLVRDIGSLSAALHALDPGPLLGLPPAWNTFIEEQRKGTADRQRLRGLAEEWAAQIDPFVESVAAGRFRRIRDLVPLHTELMRDHVFVERGDDGAWRVSGLIDFEPAMVGPRAYEWASVGLFVAEGDPTLFAAYFDGYGIPREERTPEFFREVLAHALLHRYSNLRWYLERHGTRGATTLAELARLWFGPVEALQELG